MQRVSYNDGGITLSNTQNPVINIYDTSRDPVLVKLSGNLECDSLTAGNLAFQSTSVSNLQVTNLTASSNIQCNTLSAVSSLASPSITGTLTTADQPAITSLGTLNNLTLNGTLTVAALAGNYATSISNLTNLQQLTTVNLSANDTNVADVSLTVSGSSIANAIHPSGVVNRGINFNSAQVNIAHSGNNILECANNYVRINRPLARSSQEYTTNTSITLGPTSPVFLYINSSSGAVTLNVTLPENNSSNRTIFVGESYTFFTSASSNTAQVKLNFGASITVRYGSTGIITGSNLISDTASAHRTLTCVFANSTDMRWIVTSSS